MSSGSGSAGGGGYDFQARLSAFICIFILAQEPLRWVELEVPDIPIAVAAETAGPGDDIRIELAGINTTFEVQAKRGLRADRRLDETIDKFAEGLTNDSTIHCILAINSTASTPIRDKLRQDLDRIRQGRQDQLHHLTQQVLRHLSSAGVADPYTQAGRISIREVAIENEEAEKQLAIVRLKMILADPQQAESAWNLLNNDGLNLIRTRGRRDRGSLIRLLGSHGIAVAASAVPTSSIYSTSNTTVPEKEQRYLKRVILQTELLALKGVPANLVVQSVPLEEIFIPVDLRPNRPLSDYPLTKVEQDRFRSSLVPPLFIGRDEERRREIARLLSTARQGWYHPFRQDDRVSIADLWQRMTKESPVAVIQGYPGMGKSTLLTRLAHHMAWRCLEQPDPMMPQQLEPALIPIQLSLGGYAAERAKPQNEQLTLWDYLTLTQNLSNIPQLSHLIQQRFQDGRCLVLLDGLDEVSDIQMRELVQEAIRTFILDQRAAETDPSSFNRFLITSRVAGYDQTAFPDYIHYSIAELTPKQIEAFLPRWCRALVRLDPAATSTRHPLSQEELAQAATQRANELQTMISEQEGIRELAENPLLLTLLVVMHQNHIALPRERVALYHMVTQMLLETQNRTRRLPVIPVEQAIEYLGPLSFQMQEQGKIVVSQRVAVNAIAQMIQHLKDSTAEKSRHEAERFLTQVRERGGIFVQRAEDSFGFFHRSFQEYFAACTLLKEVQRNPQQSIPELISRVRRPEQVWREPFLLMVAALSSEDPSLATETIRILLAPPQDPAETNPEGDLFLAAECLIEAKPFTIEFVVEQDVATRLVHLYEEAQLHARFEVYEEIEHLFRRWLLSLPEEAPHHPLVVTLQETLSNARQITFQRTIPMLFAMLAKPGMVFPSLVYHTFIPSLLTLAGLPEVGPYRPAMDLTPATDLTLIDLAVTALSSLGGAGPAGWLLHEVRQHFLQHPTHLRLLAIHSLESRILLTPALVPQEEEHYQRFLAAVLRWLELRDSTSPTDFTAQEIDTCVSIHQVILDCAEAARYPLTLHLLQILQRAEEESTMPSKHVWQAYLASQLSVGSPASYSELVFVWIQLFPGLEERAPLMTLLSEHFHQQDSSVQRCAEHVMAIFSNNQTGMFRAFVAGDLRSVRQLWQIGTLRYLRDMSEVWDFPYMRDLLSRANPPSAANQSDLRQARVFRPVPEDVKAYLVTHTIAEQATQRLVQIQQKATDRGEELDLMLILLSRTSYLWEVDEISDEIEQELAALTSLIRLDGSSIDQLAISEVTFRLANHLPARTANEINIIVQLAEMTSDERIQRACASSLRGARPLMPEAWRAMQVAVQSPVGIVSQTAEAFLEDFKYDGP